MPVPTQHRAKCLHSIIGYADLSCRGVIYFHGFMFTCSRSSATIISLAPFTAIIASSISVSIIISIIITSIILSSAFPLQLPFSFTLLHFCQLLMIYCKV
nr:hypothetical protein Iba_chr06aCG17650 [Ipomoea batatas]